jgi:serine phosphatase RsbU (regulator of sigma subunit)
LENSKKLSIIQGYFISKNMTLRNLLAISLLILLGTLSYAQTYKGDSWETVQEKKVGKIYILHYDRKPFVYINERGKMTGIEYDIMSEFITYLQKDRGVKLKVEWIKFDDFHKLYEEVTMSEHGVWGLPSVPLNEINVKKIQTTSVFMPDIEVLVSSKDMPVVTDKVSLRSSLRHHIPVTIQNSTVELSMNRIKKAYFPDNKYEYVKTETEIVDKIVTDKGRFGYVSLLEYYLAVKQGKELNRQKYFEIKRSNFAFILPENSDWIEAFDDFFHEDKYKQLINFFIKKHLGTDVTDVLLEVPGEAAQKIMDAEKEAEISFEKMQTAQRDLDGFKWKAYLGGALLLILLVMLVWQQSRSYQKQLKEAVEKDDALAELQMEHNHLAEQAKDGATFARHIQEALIPAPSQVKVVFPESFVYYKPREVVSGDFYWVGQTNDEKILGVFDSTGKGIKAAFVTQLSINIMKNLLQEKITNPADILREMDRRLSEMVSDAGFEFVEREGIEAAVCTVNTRTKTVTFAGAHQTMYFINAQGLQPIKGNRHDIGDIELRKKNFQAFSFPYEQGDFVYLSSDGFYDQLSSHDRMKFMLKNFQDLLVDIHDLSVQDQYRELDKIFKAWKGNTKQTDDVVVIGVKLT